MTLVVEIPERGAGDTWQVDTARQIKERLCYVGPGPGQKGHATSTKQDTGPADFELPDGTIIR